MNAVNNKLRSKITNTLRNFKYCNFSKRSGGKLNVCSLEQFICPVIFKGLPHGDLRKIGHTLLIP